MTPDQFIAVIHAHTPQTNLIGLTFIGKGNEVRNRWYKARHVEAIANAALAVNPTTNVYIRITPIAHAPDHGRGTESASTGASVLWVDYDTYGSQVDGINTLQQLEQPPTLIVNSGNGLHAYWLLNQFYTDLDAIKARNKGLLETLNTAGDVADSCFDLARILRMPGTYNLKQESTRGPLLCSVVAYHPERVYALDDFQPATLTDTTIEVWDSEPLPGDFAERLRDTDVKLYRRIVSEEWAIKYDAPLTAPGKVDRSRNDAYIATRLLGLGYTPGVALATLTQTQWFAGSKYVETQRYDYVVMTVNAALRNFRESPDRYFVKSTFVTENLTTELQRSFPFIYTAEKLWRYVNGVYVDDADQWVRAQCVARLGRRWNRHLSDETIRWLTDQCRIDFENCNQHPDHVNAQNGMVNLETGEISQHDARYLSLAQVPITYDPNVPTTAIDDFLAAILPNDAIPTFWEYVGSAFIAGRYWPKALMILVGAGDTGKSKVLEWLVNFYGGKANVSTLSLQTVADNKFATSALFGKLANIFSDLDTSEAQNTGQIKALTGDDYIGGEQKFRGFFMFKNNARLFFSANDYPRVRNPDEAFFNRAVVIPCRNKFTRETADPEIVNKLTTPQALTGALKRAIEGLQRVRANNGLTECDSIARANQEYRFVADTVSGFLHSCSFDPQFKMGKQEFYRIYRQTCENGGHKPVSDDLFFKRVSDNLARFNMTQEYIKPADKDTRQWVYCGRRPQSIVTFTTTLAGVN
jgi:putative DNA primase/helicase